LVTLTAATLAWAGLAPTAGLAALPSKPACGAVLVADTTLTHDVINCPGNDS
jgi:hypothetical protein